MKGRLVCACAGLAMAAAFPSLDLWPLAWVALLPLLVVVRGLPPSRAFRQGWIFGLSFYLAMLYWVAPTIGNYTQIPFGIRSKIAGHLGTNDANIISRIERQRKLEVAMQEGEPEALAESIAAVSLQEAIDQEVAMQEVWHDDNQQRIALQQVQDEQRLTGPQSQLLQAAVKLPIGIRICELKKQLGQRER